MINDKIEKGAIIAAVVLAVGGGAYFAGAKALGACDSKAKAKNTALTSNGATTCEKIHASAMASRNGADAKARNATVTETDAKADDCCESKATTAAMASGTCDAKAKNAVMTSTGGSCSAKATTAAMASKDGSCESKATTAVMTDADACPYTKSQATRTAAVSAKEDCPPEACEASGSGACPMEKGAKGARKDARKKAEAKGVMASVVPAEATAK
ncbi:hypothetical protein HYY27_03190 [bacterium]|nr:hypothetical protein [bacterium]